MYVISNMNLNTLVQCLHLVAGVLAIVTGYLIATNQFYKLAIIKHHQAYGFWLVVSGMLLMLYHFHRLVDVKNPPKISKTDSNDFRPIARSAALV